MIPYLRWRIREVWCVIRGGYHYEMGTFMGYRELHCPCGSVVGLEDSVFDIDGNERAQLSWQEWAKLHDKGVVTQVVIKPIPPAHIRKGS